MQGRLYIRCRLLPQQITVKISSEEAGAISLTPVVSQQMTPEELVRLALAASGKDAQRVKETLRRGTIAVGATRYRWAPVEVAAGELDAIFRLFPDPEPSRIFVPDRCREIHLVGPSMRLRLTREDAARRRWFRRRSLWDEVLAVAEPLTYVTYSYKEEADIFTATLTSEGAARLRSAASLSVYSRTSEQLRAGHIQRIEFYVTRPVEVR